MIEILNELWVQVLTCVIMAAVIVLAVFLGHKTREMVDRKKEAKKES